VAPMKTTRTIRIESLETRLLLNGNLPPVVTIDSPLPDTEIPAGGTVNLQGTGTDADGTIATWSWTIIGPINPLKPELQTFTVEDPGNVVLKDVGHYGIIFTAVDDKGAAAQPVQVNVRVGEPTNAHPEGYIDTPADGLIIQPGEKVTLGSTAFDPDGAVIAHQWVGMGPGEFEYSSDKADPGDLTLTIPGTYYFVYLPVDNNFQPDPNPAYVKVRVNERPNATIISPENFTVITPGESITFEAEGSDPDGTIVKWNWQINGPGGFTTVLLGQNPDPLTLTTAGEYTVVLTVTDNDNAADLTPSESIVTVWDSQPYFMGKVDTGYQQVYIYDCDGPGDENGIPIDGQYDNTYKAGDSKNDLIIVGTPAGAIVMSRSWILKDNKWEPADFTGLGIAVANGKLLKYADSGPRQGDVGFLAAKTGIGSVVMLSDLAGVGPFDLELPGTAAMTVPKNSGLYTQSGEIGTVIITGTDEDGKSLSCNITNLAGGLGLLVTSGHATGKINVQYGAFGVGWFGYGTQAPANLDGEITAKSVNLVYATGSFTENAKIASTTWINQLYAGAGLDGSATAGQALRQVYAKGTLAADLVSQSDLSRVFCGADMTGSITAYRNAASIYCGGAATGSVTVDGTLLDIHAAKGFSGSLNAGALNSMTVASGGLAGTVSVDVDASLIRISSGDATADIEVGGTLGLLHAANGTFRGSLSAGRITTFIAGATGADGADRATILGQDGIATLYVFNDMANTDVGVAIGGLAAGSRVELGLLRVGGNFTASNVLVGVWNENGEDAGTGNAFSDGGEDGAPYVPEGFAGRATLQRVHIGGAVGGTGADDQWAIASRNKGLWQAFTAGGDVILDQNVSGEG